jgi:hypothetical protein
MYFLKFYLTKIIMAEQNKNSFLQQLFAGTTITATLLNPFAAANVWASDTVDNATAQEVPVQKHSFLNSIPQPFKSLFGIVKDGLDAVGGVRESVSDIWGPADNVTIMGQTIKLDANSLGDATIPDPLKKVLNVADSASFLADIPNPYSLAISAGIGTGLGFIGTGFSDVCNGIQKRDWGPRLERRFKGVLNGLFNVGTTAVIAPFVFLGRAGLRLLDIPMSLVHRGGADLDPLVIPKISLEDWKPNYENEILHNHMNNLEAEKRNPGINYILPKSEP